jgi:hypothetical protein
LCKQGSATTPVSKDSRQTGQDDSSGVEAFAPPLDWQRLIFMVILGLIGVVCAFNVFSIWSSLQTWLGGSALITLAVVGMVKWTAGRVGQGFR